MAVQVSMVMMNSFGQPVLAGTLLPNIAALEDGGWADVRGMRFLSVHVKGITTATVQIRVSNNPVKPLDTVHEAPLGADITVDTLVAITGPYKWIKARVSAYTSGTINAYLEATA